MRAPSGGIATVTATRLPIGGVLRPSRSPFAKSLIRRNRRDSPTALARQLREYALRHWARPTVPTSPTCLHRKWHGHAIVKSDEK
jgi:hypothetical protein